MGRGLSTQQQRALTTALVHHDAGRTVPWFPRPMRVDLTYYELLPAEPTDAAKAAVSRMLSSLVSRGLLRLVTTCVQFRLTDSGIEAARELSVID